MEQTVIHETVRRWGIQGTQRSRFLVERFQNSENMILLKRTAAVLSRLQEYEKEIGKEFSEFSEEEVIRLFQWMKMNTTSTFRNVKSNIYLPYLKWLGMNGSPNAEIVAEQLKSIQFSDIEISSGYEREFFESFASLRSAIRQTAYQHCSDTEGIGKYDLITAILYLAWCGVKKEEAVVLRKEDVMEQNGSLFLRESGRMVWVNPKAAAHFAMFRDSGGFTVLTSQLVSKEEHYMPSPYLLRSKRSSQISVVNLVNMVSKFNDLAQESEVSKFFRYDRIYLSGRFRELMKWEEEQGRSLGPGDKEMMERVFQENHSSKDKQSLRYQDFLRYKEYVKKVTF